MKAIQLTNDMHTYVDDCDYDPLMRWQWAYHKDGYAARNISVGGENYIIYMHRQILGLTDRRVECDHINGNRLDNRFGNLRAVTHAENQLNRHATLQAQSKRRGTSYFRGVYWDKQYFHWRAAIWYKGKTISLGNFDNEAHAALAYNKKAIELFGSNARLNIILEELL